MTVRGERQRRADIVRYWRAVEMFSPQQVGKTDPRKGMYPVDAGTPLPWEQGHPVRRRPVDRNMTRQHTVYCGVYRIAAVRDVLLEVFGGGEEDHDGRLDGDSAMLAFEVTEDGLLVQDSIVFSACAWATGRARKPGPGARTWLDGFDEEKEYCERTLLDLGDGKLDIVDRVAGRAVPFAGLVCQITLGAMGGVLAPALAPLLGEVAAGLVAGGAQSLAEGLLPDLPGSGQGEGEAASETDDEGEAPKLGVKPLTVRDLSAVTRWLADRFGVTEDLAPHTVRVQTREVSRRKAGRPSGAEFLNSFIADDLHLVAGKLAKGDPGRALGEYLTAAHAVRTHARVDIRQQPGAVLAGVTPSRFPLGRWPAKTGHPLVLSQQFAVNTILEQLADGEGLYAVNGPPGTGKTTQLRDLIAAVLALRAERLAGLARPEDAFQKTPLRWSTGNFSRSLLPLKPELTGYEMVIASANNGAVENVSVELPAAGSVAAEWQPEASYFPDQGRLILDGSPAWGALAAKLGNKGNRLDFRSDYWFGPTKAGARSRAQGGEENVGMRELLKQTAVAQRSTTADWQQAVRRFREARQAVVAMRDERQNAQTAFVAYHAAMRSVETARRGTQDAEERWRGLRVPLEEARAVRHTAQGIHQATLERLAQHGQTRPGLMAGVFSLGATRREWEMQDELLRAAEREAREAFHERTRILAIHERADEMAARDLDRLREELEGANRHAAQVGWTVTDAIERWGPYLPGQEATEGRTPEEARELSSPWSDPDFTRARTRLFLAAMDLHRAFLLGAADRMRKNLDAAMDVLCGDAPKTLPPATVLAAWQNLFLAVPVVSTTFASLDRMFAGLGAAALGWVLIDEAGQATAQMPVGALWRAKRAVIVGDPLQLEPVVTLPHTGQQALRRTFGVDEEWAPSSTSAQRVADRLNRYGTWLPAPSGGEEERVWVGSPLRVHRRCEDPMFSISNDIAYEGLMVHGVHHDEEYPIARRSVWWHVGAGTSDGKWSPGEGEAANVIVHRLMDQGLEPGQIFVVSPFRDVVGGLKRSLCRTVPRDRIGTVHTTQGKEADVVLLVLGSGTKAGPRAWASCTPNLLNVAVSRARRRLFVVGDHDAWSRHRYFDVLAGRLTRMTPEDQAVMRQLAPAALPETCRC
ncbi:DEAD/DEAH box helicase [Streptomyces sp. NPDC085524]|uniref:DEAD/DEAH box helicase n=1 Tax=Streptomyces sp. NPDC085524 TaxID=3365728 RepID=UPI0037D7DBAF